MSALLNWRPTRAATVWTLLSISAGSGLLFWGYFVDGYWQGLLMGFGTTLALVAVLVVLESVISKRVSDEVRGVAPLHVYEAAVRTVATPPDVMSKPNCVQALHESLCHLGLAPTVATTLDSRRYESSAEDLIWTLIYLDIDRSTTDENSVLVSSGGLRMSVSLAGKELADESVGWTRGAHLLTDKEAIDFNTAYERIVRRIGSEIMRRRT